MVKVREDLTGQKINSLLVLEQVEDHITSGGRHHVQYRCLCDCGNETIVQAHSLKCGHTKTCGTCGSCFCSRNTYKDMGDYMIGYTSKGEEFYFDKEDYDLVKDYTWNIEPDGYVVTDPYKKNGIHKNLYMHRLVMGIGFEEYDYNKVIDHKKTGKKYKADNRKENLRICTTAENNLNRPMQKNNTSGYTGIRWDKNIEKWRAFIGVNNKLMALGSFTELEDAIECRKEAELQYWGKCEG